MILGSSEDIPDKESESCCGVKVFIVLILPGEYYGE
jgi:hypothetical protein